MFQLLKKVQAKAILLSLLIALMALTIGILSGCGEKESAQAEDILTQKKAEEGRTQITVLVKYAFTINAFEKAVEERFPEIDIVQVGNYTSNMGKEEYAKRLEVDDLTDVIMTWPLNVGEEYWSERLIDLSGMEFSNKYNISMLDSISKDGALYYLPGPSQVRGIVYNKTMFQENGWKVPKNYDEFIKLCNAIQDTGIKALQLGFRNSEVLDTAFTGYSFGDLYGTPSDSQWVKEYNEGEHSFGDHFSTALDTFQDLIDQNVISKEDLKVDYSKREQMFFSRRCAMVEDSVLMARMGDSYTGTDDEYGLMPFFNRTDGDSWARLYAVCYIGLNKHLEDKGNEDKYDLVMELMDYISTKDGQEALMGDTGAMFSSLIGVGATDVPEIVDLQETMKRGNYGIFSELKNAQNALRKGLARMLTGTMTPKEVIEMVDEENQNPPKEDKPEVLASASQDFSVIETGNYVTDVMREAADTEIALFMDNGKDGHYNGKGISGKIYKGDLTSKDLFRILPDLKEGDTGTLWKVTMTGKDLLNTLEHSINVSVGGKGWFYYFSGLKMEFNPTAKPGKRIKSITLDDGSKIDPKKEYSIAVADNSTPEKYFKSCKKTKTTIRELLEKDLKEKGTISPSADGRFVIVK